MSGVDVNFCRVFCFLLLDVSNCISFFMYLWFVTF